VRRFLSFRPPGTGSNVVILTNMSTPGNIAFSSPIKIDSLNDPQSISVGDFNGDGKLDLAVGEYNAGTWHVYIYINTSSGGAVSFATNVQAANYAGGLGGDPQEITVSDLNGDGLPDFAVVDSKYHMYTFQNVWTGGSFAATNFASVSNYVTGSAAANTICILSGDIDGDGRPDIAVGNYEATNIVVFQNASQY
jgi:hypothetical protein